MPLRRSAPPPPPPEPVESVKVGGKGRATPKRREAEQRRRTPTAAPTSRWEAYKRRRRGVAEERRTMRGALRTGDERHLPPRDAGPTKAFVRDLVDARQRGTGGLLIFALLVSLVLGSIKTPAVQFAVFVLFLGAILAVIVDMSLLARRVHREVITRFGPREAVGVRTYAVIRALQFRRWRMPPARVKKGAKLD